MARIARRRQAASEPPSSRADASIASCASCAPCASCATLLILGLSLCGCPSPNTFTAPRTLDPGDLQIQVAAEVFAYSSRVAVPSTDGGSPSTSTVWGGTPALPTIGFRYGLVDGLELGARVANFDSLAGDAKVRLLRGTLDLAVDPGIQLMDLPTPSHDIGVFYFYAPLLLGLNLSDDVTLVAAPGFAYSIATASSTDADKAPRAGASTDAKATLGLGVEIRASDKLAFYPEVTCMKGFGAANAILCMAGCALNVGAQPTYPEPADGR